MNTQLDTFAYTNRLRHLPPNQKLRFASVVLLLALVSHPPVQLAIAAWLSVWIVGYAGIPLQAYRRSMLGVLVFLLTTLPILLVDAVPLADLASVWPDRLVGWNFADWQLYITRRGLVQAGQIFCRSLACISCLFFIAFTVPLGELAIGLEKWGCPGILTELLLLSYRFVFLLAEVAQQISTAQVSRGGYRSKRRAMQSLSLLISQLLQRTIERYHQLALGVKARGFRHEFRFWQPRNYRYSRRYELEAIGGCSLLLGWEAWFWISVR